MSRIEKYRPAVKNSSLILLSGIVWIGVGIMMVSYAASWLSGTSDIHASMFLGAGLALALIVHHFGFLKIADNNIKRILRTNGLKCLFSFFPLRSYFTIAIMIALGAFLRHSDIPKQYLSVLYIGIGLALILSSVRYVRTFIREIHKGSSL